ncbi:uncharacterized protein IL334_005927 [Kwoniella shivajii]|uniref:Thiamine-binding protein domain-containing protein n=1 Tax=Kwoniella shivajii TaxID=564305 RepID=A0ABZ1D6C8_9TREE|nr:hypothetical protein IL334_005927 [Kwoniella shivajii]
MTVSLYAVADFCLIPVGLPQTSVAREIAEVQRVLEKSGLDGYGTNLEGPWDDVVRVIGECHQAVHDLGCPRIATDVRIGTRTDRSITSGGNDGKVQRVVDILASEKK